LEIFLNSVSSELIADLSRTIAGTAFAQGAPQNSSADGSNGLLSDSWAKLIWNLRFAIPKASSGKLHETK